MVPLNRLRESSTFASFTNLFNWYCSWFIPYSRDVKINETHLISNVIKVHLGVISIQQIYLPT